MTRTGRVGPLVEKVERECSGIDVASGTRSKGVLVRPICETELSDKTEKSTRGTKLRFSHVASVCYGGDIVGRQIVACSPVLSPVGNSRQTVSSAATSKVWNSAVTVAMEFDHRGTSGGATDRVDQVVRQDSVGQTD